MTAQPPKKKRYEGLIQFQDPFRQVMACLQAALAERFSTGAQVDFLRHKDSPDLSHFLLTADGSPVEPLLKGLGSQHILLRIEQLSEAALPQTWTPDSETRIAAWLDSRDPLVAQYIFQCLAGAGSIAHSHSSSRPKADLHFHSHRQDFDLATGSAWTGIVEPWQKSKAPLVASPWWTPERDKLLTSFHNDAKTLFKRVDEQKIATDGCSVAFLIEGITALDWDQLSAKAVENLAKPDRHLVSVNYMTGTPNRLQCLYVAPMRLPVNPPEALSLKGFLLLRDIKAGAKDTQAVIAS